MQEHIHTGFSAFLFAGISAIILLNVTRWGAAHLVNNPSTEGLGKVIGSLVSFPA